MSKEKLNQILKIMFEALKNILVPIAFFMHGWKVYSETKNGLLVLNLSLILIAYLLIVLLFSLRQTLKSRQKEIKELWQVQDEIFKAVSIVIKSDLFSEDDKHRYSLIEINYKKEGYTGYAYMHLVGKNVSGDVSDHIKIRIAADSPIDNIKDLELRATDKYSNEEIHNEIIKELETLYFKPHKIYFKDPLPHGENFDIEIKYKWPGSFTRQSDYVFYILHSYKKGVDHFKTKIDFDFKPRLLRLYEINKEGGVMIYTPLTIPVNRDKNLVSFEISYPIKSILLQWTPSN